MSGQESREQPLVVAEAAHLAQVLQAPTSVVLDGKGRSAVLLNSQGAKIRQNQEGLREINALFEIKKLFLFRPRSKAGCEAKGAGFLSEDIKLI